MQKNTTKEAFFNLGCLEVHLSLSTLMLVSLNTCWVVMVVDFIFYLICFVVKTSSTKMNAL